MGNHAAYTDATGATAYTANNANQYKPVGGTASIYDANGNLLSDGIKNYAWDAENQLVTPPLLQTGQGYVYVQF